jgi:hypothetical protein
VANINLVEFINGEQPIDVAQEEELTPIDSQEVHSICRDFLTSSRYTWGLRESYLKEEDYTEDTDGTSGQDSLALRYYYGARRGDEVAGRSSFVSTDVADMVEATLAQISPMLLNQHMADFEPVAPADEKQAAAETRFCNHIVMKQNNGYRFFYSAIKTSLLHRVGAIEVDIDDTPTVTEEYFQNVDRDSLVQILQPTLPNQEVVILDSSATENDTTDITVKRVTKVEKIRLTPILAKDLFWMNNTEGEEPEELLFVARRRYMSRSNLVLLGADPDVVAGIPTSTFVQTEVEQPASEVVEVYFCYAMIDMYNSGIAERRLVVLAGREGNTFLINKAIDHVPIAIGTPFLMPGSITGLSLFDKLRSVQDGKTFTVRQYLDNMNSNNNRRVAVNTKAIEDPDSVYDSKPGGVIKCTRPPAEVIFPIPVDDIGISCQALLGYFDQVTSHRAGASLDMQTQQQNIEGDSAHGVERQMSAKELMASMIARNLAETLIRGTFKLVHFIARTRLKGNLLAKFGKSWEQTTPSSWLPRESVTVVVGLSQAKKREKYGILSTLLATQLQLQQSGSLLVSPNTIYNTLMDLTFYGLEENAEKYIIDPESPQAQAAAQQTAESSQQEQQEQKQLAFMQLKAQTDIAEAEVTKARAALQKNQMQMIIDSLKHELEELKAASAEGKAVSELQFKYNELATGAALKLTEIEARNKTEENVNFVENKGTVQ